MKVLIYSYSTNCPGKEAKKIIDALIPFSAKKNTTELGFAGVYGIIKSYVDNIKV